MAFFVNGWSSLCGIVSQAYTWVATGSNTVCTTVGTCIQNGVTKLIGG